MIYRLKKLIILNVLFTIYAFTWLAITTVSLYFLFKTTPVISFLEDHQISVYYLVDSLFLIAFILFFLSIFSSILGGILKKDLNFLSTFFKPIGVILISAYFAVSYDYGGFSRSEIGFFYNMPKGESIGYPK